MSAYGVMDSTEVHETFSLGSNPSRHTILPPKGAKKVPFESRAKLLGF